MAVRPHSIYTRRGDDLHCQVELPMTAASLGTTLQLWTFDGERELVVSPGTQPAETLTMRSLGVTHLRGSGRGDLIVHTNIQTPTHLTPEQEDLLRQLATLRGEERPTGKLAPMEKGFMGKLRDAFKAR